MDFELMALRARVEVLERMIRVAAVAMVSMIILGLPTAIRAVGPTQVTAPFTVVDDHGRVLLKVEAQPGRGASASFYNEAGRTVLRVGGSPTGCCGWIGVYSDDDAKPKAQLAVQKDNTGVVRLAGDGDDFSQVNGKGFVVRRGSNNLAALSASPDGGFLRLRDHNNSVIGEFTSMNGGAGKITIFGKGAQRTTLGVAADDAGLIRLDSIKDSFVILHGNGAIRTVNSSGKAVTELGTDEGGSGILDVRHKSGDGGVRLEVAPDGTGAMKIHSPPFEVKAQMGVKEGGKGDVCVMGGKGNICLSGIAIKSFIPW